VSSLNGCHRADLKKSMVEWRIVAEKAQAGKGEGNPADLSVMPVDENDKATLYCRFLKGDF